MQIVDFHDHHIVAGRLGRQSTVVDCGANVGLFSLAVLEEHGCRVMAFEPYAKLCEEHLAPIGRMWPQFKWEQCAIAPASGAVDFWNFGKKWSNRRRPNPWGANSTVPQSHVFGHKDVFGNEMTSEHMRVPAKSLDDALAGFHRVDLLKMDIEGAEIGVLSAASAAALRKCGQITVEFHAFIGQRFIPAITAKDVLAVVARMASIGFKSEGRGGHPDYLFWQD